LEEGLRFVEALDGLSIAYLEEPLRDSKELPELKARCGVGYAVDETLQDAQYLSKEEAEPLRGVLREAGAWIWKPTVVHPSWFLPAWREQESMPCVLSGAFESGVGHAALAQLAGYCSGDDTPAGLDTYRWIGRDLLQQRLEVERGELDLNDCAQRVALPVEDALQELWTKP
jgi:O-succinylbenzoate synthase